MAAGTMKAAIMDKPLSIAVKEMEIPVPKENEALIKVYCIGICGSDVHYYEHGKIGRYVVKEPIVLGHELAGEVVEVGVNVTNVAVGDRVAVEPGGGLRPLRLLQKRALQFVPGCRFPGDASRERRVGGIHCDAQRLPV